MNSISPSRSLRTGRGWTTLIAKVAVLNLGTMASICFFHDIKLSRVKSRNFILSTVVSSLSLYIMSKILKGLFFLCKMHKARLFPVFRISD
jgi:hypothetical protein